MSTVALELLRHSKKDHSTYSAIAFSCLSIAFLLDCVWQLVKILRGRVLFTQTELIEVDTHDLAVPEFSGCYEIWLFIGGGFTKYSGNISIKTSEGQIYQRKLPKRIPPFQSIRQSPAPVVFRLVTKKTKEEQNLNVAFRLSPRVVPTAFGSRHQKTNVEELSILIKKA